MKRLFLKRRNFGRFGIWIFGVLKTHRTLRKTQKTPKAQGMVIYDYFSYENHNFQTKLKSLFSPLAPKSKALNPKIALKRFFEF
ncbi:hypothetical protein CQA58_04090 [Helicobacter brantae]|uniref:Uncharacterized protein n=1 Tax=Helicobacter brantae TaxID=375927 RepID=A0A3D8J180_9HELI|nr:hypothetical protein CQA58_04090 [Helicobacter brantae]